MRADIDRKLAREPDDAAVHRPAQRHRRGGRHDHLPERRARGARGWRSAPPGPRPPRSGPGSTPRASCCCSRTPSRCSAASRSSSARTGTTSSPGRRSPRLGAKQDGVLRNHRRLPDGSLRDTVVFSIIDTEWPAVRTGLRHRLARCRLNPRTRASPRTLATVSDAADLPLIGAAALRARAAARVLRTLPTDAKDAALAAMADALVERTDEVLAANAADVEAAARRRHPGVGARPAAPGRRPGRRVADALRAAGRPARPGR